MNNSYIQTFYIKTKHDVAISQPIGKLFVDYKNVNVKMLDKEINVNITTIPISILHLVKRLKL